MEAFFKNFIIVFILMGIATRTSNYFLQKKVKQVYILSFVLGFILILPIVSLTIGFDIAFAEYLPSLLVWLLVDHLRAQVKKKNKN